MYALIYMNIRECVTKTGRVVEWNTEEDDEEKSINLEIGSSIYKKIL